ncbi:hypothetical protein GCM10029963_73410 [Micromonospora andamanensis]
MGLMSGTATLEGQRPDDGHFAAGMTVLARGEEWLVNEVSHTEHDGVRLVVTGTSPWSVTRPPSSFTVRINWTPSSRSGPRTPSCFPMTPRFPPFPTLHRCAAAKDSGATG